MIDAEKLNAEKLNVGDTVGISFHRYHGPNVVRKGVVSKKTKTTIKVLFDPHSNEMTFNIISGRKRGGSSSDWWEVPFLVSAEEMAKLQLELHVHHKIIKKASERLGFIRSLEANIKDDAAFAVVLEKLNQREYAPIHED